MLLVGSRGDGRRGMELGFGGGGGGGVGSGRSGGRGEGMEVNELEEGEAYSGQDDRNDYTDPDIALSYIDGRLQDLLGQFQRDFLEGGVSAENLGAKFGEYGSFLPAYQRSPGVRAPPRSPLVGQNPVVLRSPCNPSFENRQISTATTVSRNSNPPAALLPVDNSAKIKTKISAVEPVMQRNTLDKPTKGNDLKSLKVRIKVGPNSSSARNNTAIYSGLGLDISPSSSGEDSPFQSGGISPKLQHAPDESPMTILQIMTSFSSEDYLLSPLPGSMLHLTKKKVASLKNCKTSVPREGIRESHALVADMMLPGKDVNDFIENKVKTNEKIRRIIEPQGSNSKDDMCTVSKREIDIGTSDGQKPALNASVSSSSRSANLKKERLIVGDSVKAASRILDLPKETKMISQDRMSSPDLEQGYQSGSIESIKNSTAYSRGKPKSKTNLEEKLLDDRKISDHNDTSSGTWRDGMVKVDKNEDTARSDAIANRVKKTHATVSVESPSLMSAQKATLYEQDSERISHRKDKFSEGKWKLKESSRNASPAVELKENMPAVSSAVLKEKKKSSHARDHTSEKKSKGLKSRNEVVKGCSKESHRVMGDVKADQMHYRTDLEVRYKDTHKNTKVGHETGSLYPEKSNDRSGLKKFDDRPVSQAFLDAPVNAPLVSAASNSDVGVSLQAPAPASAPVVIKENWVACDKCQIWRLLPYETDTVNLPKKWQCSMQTWLPGLNKCHVSEAETTKALNALYLIPAPENGAELNGHHENAAAPITSTNVLHFNQRSGHNMQTVSASGKKKHGLNNEPSQKVSAKNKNISNLNEGPSETNFANRSSQGQSSKSSDHDKEKHNYKQKEKYKLTHRYSDGGDNTENSSRSSKSKSKREGDNDGFRPSKKSKIEGSNYPMEDWHSNVAVAGLDAPITDSGIPTIGKNSLKSADYPSSMDFKCDPEGRLPAPMKRKKDEIPPVNGDLKKHFNSSNVEKSDTMDISAKKRKLKEWQASQVHQESRANSQNTSGVRVVVKEAYSESDLRKQKKAMKSISDGMGPGTSNIDRRMDKGHLMKIISKEDSPGEMDGARVVAGKEQLGKGHGSTIIHRDSTGNLKRDVVYAQHLAAATSSSSKVSGSRKSKPNILEARESPPESVSSSPLRISNSERLSTKKSSAGKGVGQNASFLNTGSPKRCLDLETDGASDRSGMRKEAAAAFQRSTLENQRAVESGFPDSLSEVHGFHGNEANLSYDGKARDLMHLSSGHDDLSPPVFEDGKPVSGTGNTKYIREALDANYNHDQDEQGDYQRPNGPNQWKSAKSSSLSSKEKYRNSKTDVHKGREQTESVTKKKSSGHQSESEVGSHGRSIHHEYLRGERYDAQETKDERDQDNDIVKSSSAGRKDGHPKYGIQDKLDTNGPSIPPNQHKDSDSKIAGTSIKFNTKENLQQTPPQHDDKSSHVLSDKIGESTALGKGKSQMGSRSEGCPTATVNGDASKVVKQLGKLHSQNGLPNFPDGSGPARKDNYPIANVIFKEARVLKHTANRLKNEGLAAESTGLYFEAALKFLHGASLMEPPSLENAKQGGATQAMQMYSDTAKLCLFCACEYEELKQMAAASLAYKCVEVAYMKAAYYKHPSANKDRQDLQVALKMPLPGDSPSSSASDLDNLNNQGALDKAALVKGTVTPVPGSHVIAARNHPKYIRVLDYTSDMNCAFEATRKSQNAFRVAIANLGVDGDDRMSSVKRVLDFNFHNVEGLLRLVRLSMETISQ